MSAADGDLHGFSGLEGNGLLFSWDGWGGFDPDPEEDIHSVADTAQNASAMIRSGFYCSIGADEGVIILAAKEDIITEIYTLDPGYPE